MLSLDLFNSKFEQALQEGAVSMVAEQDPPAEPHPSNLSAFNTPKNIEQVKKIWITIQQHFLDPDSTYNWLNLKWDNHPDNVTLSVNQVFSILKKLNAMSKQNRQLTLLTKFGDRNSFLSWLSGVKITPRPLPKKEVPKGQQSFDLKEFKETQKKSSDNPDFKSTKLDRLKTQARAKYPSAASDIEALSAEFVDQQEQDQAELSRVKSVNTRQDDLIKQITALNKEQDSEIDSLASDEAQLQKNIQQLQAANAGLAQKLAAMSQRRTKATTDVIPGPTPSAAPAGPGVSVAPDKQAPKRDQRLVQYAQRLRQQIKNLELQVAIKDPQDQERMRQEIEALKTQLAQLQRQPEQLPQPSVAQTTVGGQAADVLSRPTPVARDSDELDFTDYSEINPDIADMLKSIQTKSKKAPKRAKKKEPVAELDEGSVFGQQDFDTQMDLAKLKSRLTQPKPAQSSPAVAAEPQPIPARLSDLQSKQEKVVNLAGIKKEIEKLQAQATRGGRILPRGLAADLEDYFTVSDIDTAYDEMMSKYQKQLAALQQYLGMRKVLWSPKKDVHEMRAKELNESGMETWTVHFTDGTAVRVRVSDETDPAMVRKHYANKGKTVAKFDYGFGVDQPAGPGPEAHEPGSGRAVSSRTGDPLPEDTKSEFKAVALAKIKKALANPKLDPSTRKDFETRLHRLQALEEGRAGYNPLTSKDHWHEVERYLSSQINDLKLDPESRAEARRHYQEKRQEAQQKGWAK